MTCFLLCGDWLRAARSATTPADVGTDTEVSNYGDRVCDHEREAGAERLIEDKLANIGFAASRAPW